MSISRYQMMRLMISEELEHRKYIPFQPDIQCSFTIPLDHVALKKKSSFMVRTTSLIRYMMRALFLAMCALVMVYFGYHAVIGDRGLLAWFQLEQEAEELRQELMIVQAEREHLEHRVSLMRPESLDPDMIDIRAREVLNLAHPTEITILRSIN